MYFVAIDVETANPDSSSICQVGSAFFEAGKLIDEISFLVDPEDWFDAVNIQIHGIVPEDVEGKIKYPAVHESIVKNLSGHIFVCHTAFDRLAFSHAAEKYDLEPLNNIWLDTAKVVRRAWPEFAWSGYSLQNITAHLGIEYKAHDAGEDARACGLVLIEAIKKTGLTVNDWLARVNQPLDLKKQQSSSIKFEGNPDGPLFGEVLVFTGKLKLTRVEAAKLAADMGCTVHPGVNKQTTILVLGDQDDWKLAGFEKSSKQRKVEALIGKGRQIKIISEATFNSMVNI